MYRDDRDAQLARLEALDRENRQLRTALAELRAAAEPGPGPSRERDDHAHEALPAPPSAICVLEQSRGLADPIRIGVLATLYPIAIGLLALLSR